MALHIYLFEKMSLLLTKIAILIKTNYILATIISIISFFEPISLLLYLLIFAVGIDCISGLGKALKTKSKITSWRLRDTIIKLFLYLTLTMLIYGIQIGCLYGLPLANVVAGFILFAEAVSIAENIDEISDNKLGLARLIRGLRNKFIKNNK